MRSRLSHRHQAPSAFGRAPFGFRLWFAFVGLGVLTVFAFTGYSFYENFTSETFSLRKDTYTCTAQHLEANGQDVWTICDTYTRVK